MSRTIDDIAFDLNNNEFSHTYFLQLLTALHDAINSPKGVVPESADKFYCVGYYDKD